MKQQTQEQAEKTQRAKNQMCMWYAHRQTTVYLVTDQEASKLPSARAERGWPLFVDSCCSLFKTFAHVLRTRTTFRTAEGQMLFSWTRVSDLANADDPLASAIVSRIGRPRSRRRMFCVIGAQQPQISQIISRERATSSQPRAERRDDKV